MQVVGMKKNAIGRNFITRFQQNHISRDNLLTDNLRNLSVTTDFHGLFLSHGREHGKLLRRVTLKIESYRRGKENSQKNTNRLHKIILHKSQHQRDGCGDKEYLDDGITVLIQIQLPQGDLMGWCQHIPSTTLALLLDFRIGESLWVEMVFFSVRYLHFLFVFWPIGTISLQS